MDSRFTMLALALALAAPAARGAEQPAATPAGPTPPTPATAEAVPAHAALAEASAGPAAPPADVSALAARVAALEAKVAPAQKGGPSASSAGPWVKLNAFVHADARFFVNDDRRKLTDEFLVRRVQPDLQLGMGAFLVRVRPDFGQGNLVVQDAYGEWHGLRWLSVRAGKERAPFGLEQLQNPNRILLVERSLANNLVPNRDTGVELFGEVGGVLSYMAGIFDGAPDGASIERDVSDDKDGEGRVFLRPFARTRIGAISRLGFGIAGTYGATHGDPKKNPDLGSYKSDGQATFFSYRSDATAPTVANTVVAAGRRLRLSPQATWYAGPAAVLFEYVLSEQRIVLNGQVNRARNRAWQAAAAVILTGEQASEDVVTPAHPVGGGGLGALQVAARYATLEVDRDVFPVFADPTVAARRARAWTVGLSWWLTAAVRLEANYARTAFTGGAKDASGAMADRPTENAILSRAQVSF